MKIAEFKANHVLNDIALAFDARPVLHKDGRPVTGGELTPGKVYAVSFDEKKPGAPAVLSTVQENRAFRRKLRRKGR